MNDDNRPFRILPPKLIEYAAAAALILLAVFLAVEAVATVSAMNHPTAEPADTITVTGDGQATLPPDVARVSFTVQNTAPAVSDAQTATTKQANAAINSVKGQGIADKDVKTLSYDITPQYSYPSPCVGVACPVDRTPKVIGYQVSETIQVTERDLVKVGDLLAGLGKLEVQNVSGPAFALDDPTAGYDAARADAITKAKAQAGLLAGQLGVSLGRIVNFSESSGAAPYPLAYGMGAAETVTKAPTPVVPTGENTYTASVSITYEIH